MSVFVWATWISMLSVAVCGTNETTTCIFGERTDSKCGEFCKCCDGWTKDNTTGLCSIVPGPVIHNCPTQPVPVSVDWDSGFVDLRNLDFGIVAEDYEGNSINLSLSRQHVWHCRCPSPVPVSVIATATDVFGATAYCTFDIIVEDHQAPHFNGCPTSAVISYTEIVKWNRPLVQDNVGIQYLQEPDFVHDEYYAPGNYDIAYKGTDWSNNTNVCMFRITVIYDTAPTIRYCPTSTEKVYVDRNRNYAIFKPYIKVTSGRGHLLPVTFSKTKFWHCKCPLPHPKETVFTSATDEFGQTVTCNFTVAIYDDYPPQFQSCPRKTSVDYTDQVIPDPPRVKDNVGIQSVFNESTEYHKGYFISYYKAIDWDNNIVKCEIEVEIKGAPNTDKSDGSAKYEDTFYFVTPLCWFTFACAGGILLEVICAVIYGKCEEACKQRTKKLSTAGKTDNSSTEQDNNVEMAKMPPSCNDVHVNTDPVDHSSTRRENQVNPESNSLQDNPPSLEINSFL